MSKKVKVHIRLRPSAGKGSPWGVLNNSIYQTYRNKKTTYSCFNHVYSDINNEQIYARYISADIESFLAQENCTIFAYGQTGSGKTHTMLGYTEPGIIKLALRKILDVKPVSISYLEIYNEKIFDLYNKNELQVYRINKKNVIVDLFTTKVEKWEQAMRFIDICEENRKYGYTEFNDKSSRSHTIFQVSYKEGKKIVTLNLIDLAGSERASRNDNRRKEGGYINKSLLSLCTVINNIGRGAYVGFRDSKLTRILQSSMDGSTNLVAICMISPQLSCVDESLSTLKFAARLSNLELKAEESAAEDTESSSASVCFCEVSKEKNRESKTNLKLSCRTNRTHEKPEFGDNIHLEASNKKCSGMEEKNLLKIIKQIQKSVKIKGRTEQGDKPTIKEYGLENDEVKEQKVSKHENKANTERSKTSLGRTTENIEKQILQNRKLVNNDELVGCDEMSLQNTDGDKTMITGLSGRSFGGSSQAMMDEDSSSDVVRKKKKTLIIFKNSLPDNKDDSGKIDDYYLLPKQFSTEVEDRRTTISVKDSAKLLCNDDKISFELKKKSPHLDNNGTTNYRTENARLNKKHVIEKCETSGESVQGESFGLPMETHGDVKVSGKSSAVETSVMVRKKDLESMPNVELSHDSESIAPFDVLHECSSVLMLDVLHKSSTFPVECNNIEFTTSNVSERDLPLSGNDTEDLDLRERLSASSLLSDDCNGAFNYFMEYVNSNSENPVNIQTSSTDQEQDINTVDDSEKNYFADYKRQSVHCKGKPARLARSLNDLLHKKPFEDLSMHTSSIGEKNAPELFESEIESKSIENTSNNFSEEPLNGDDISFDKLNGIVNFYELGANENEYSTVEKLIKLKEENALLEERIKSLENMILLLLKLSPSKKLNDIFVLEKQMFILLRKLLWKRE